MDKWTDVNLSSVEKKSSGNVLSQKMVAFMQPTRSNQYWLRTKAEVQM